MTVGQHSQWALVLRSYFLLDPCFSSFFLLFVFQWNNVTPPPPLSCSSDDEEVLFISSAVYGRGDNTTCSSGRSASELGNVNCSSEVTDKVAERCNGKSSCIVGGFNLMFGDPCVGTYKYLDVSYTCQSRCVTCEHDGQQLIIHGATYGRGDNTTCSSGRSASELGNVNCSSEVTDKVAERCNGKSSCIIEGFNLMFGDPCVGTYKYLDVSYTCICK
uniref:SUEL-type lectin domain-containing protein n=1 Tax=Scophthalmus maximus TaxID=52904 RepID=A0A8D3BTV9_SCOMX